MSLVSASNPSNTSSSLTLTIEKLIYGGEGLARLAQETDTPAGASKQRILLVPYSAPGDELTVQPEAGPRPKHAHITAIVQPGPERTTPRCEIFGRCGGCQWQHLTLPAQQHWKQVILQENLARIGKFPDMEILPILASVDPEESWKHRNNVQWTWADNTHQAKNEGSQLGYLEAGSHQIIEFPTCYVIPERLNELAKDLRETLPSGIGLKRVQVRSSRSGDWLIALQGVWPKSREGLKPWARGVQERFPNIKGIVCVNSPHKVVLAGQPYLVEALNGFKYQVSVDSFFQTNVAMTERLLKTMRQLLGTLFPEPAESAIDLYAGVGLFALGLNNFAKAWHAVEIEGSAVVDFRANLKLHKRENVTLHPGDISHKLTQEPLVKLSAELAVIDPPRAGCTPDVLDWLDAHISRCVAYLSCDPSTLARDLRILADKCWRIHTIQPIDMFPQTYHIETLVILVKDIVG